MTKNQLSFSDIMTRSCQHDRKVDSNTPSKNSVYSILLPLQDQTLLLPRTAIAEVIPYQDPTPWQGAPPWLCGTLNWRQQPLVLISFEALQEKPISTTTEQTRIVVINTIRELSQRKFYALTLQGIPQLILAHTDNVSAATPAPSNPEIHCHVAINHHPVVIPNLDYLEEVLQRYISRSHLDETRLGSG